MPEKSNGKKNGSGTTLDLMGDDEAVKPRPARKPAAPVQAAETVPVDTGGALFGGDDVDLDARHPADVPVGGFPAPSQIAQVSDSSDPFADGEEDPFEDSVMARMLADEPPPLSSPLRAAREDFNVTLPAAAGPDLEAFADPVAAPEVEQVVDFEEPALVPEPEVAAAEFIPEPEFTPEPATVLEAEALEEMELPMPAVLAETPEAVPEMFADQPEPQAAPAPLKKTAPGLTFSRRYTQPGQDVWDTTEWELRTASITGSDGTVVFEQRGVEIPKSWSQLATNVVVSKYFRGQIGTLEREYSVKQLIGRVADKILEWARLGSYFATDADAETFHDELRYILLHQFAAFNSPVWFNLGWAGRRQAVSACLPYGVRVNTDRGLLPIGEIVRLFQSMENPQISTYAPDGTPARIVAAVCNGRKRVFNFHLADGSTLRCTSNHRVFVRAGKGEIIEKEAGQLVIGVDRLILNRSVLLPETAAQSLDSITPDADVAWLTGLMVGDGYCGRSKTLTSDTWDLKLNTLPEKERAEAILTKYGVPFRTHPKSWGFCLRGHGAVSRAFWSALGLWGRVGDKLVPEWIYRTSAENVAAFLGGLFDSDGHVTENGNRRLPVFSNTSLPLMQATQTLLRSLGIYSSLTAYTDAREDYARKTSYSLGIHDNVSVEQFQEVIGFTHAHKQARMTERLTDAALSVRSADVLVVSKTQGGPEYVYDIQTESETFWAEGILLHNCYITEVDDSMESILDLYKTEGMLFKDGSGCTSGDSLVHVQDAGFLPIRNLYKKFFAEGRSVHEFDGQGRYIEVGDADVYTLSIDPETGCFGRDQVLRVWQYDLPQEDKLTVRLDTGAKATVSCWHPFLVWDGEKITHRRADQLRRGDAVLGPNATARAAVSIQPTTFQYETSYFDRQESHVVTLDEDVAWLCGYFMGDGSLGARQNRVQTTSGRLCTYDGLRLRFYDETEETLRRVQQVIERVFGDCVQILQGQYCLMLSYTGRRVTRFFAQLFGVGSKTYSLSMPAFVWNSPRSVQLAFLAGLIDSDGYIAEGGRAKYSSASREFAGQVAALASFLGLGGGTVTDRHVETATVLHRVATTAQRQEFAAYMAHPERRRRLLETCSDKPQRKFCLPLSETLAHDLFGGDRAPADWLSVPVGDSTFHLGRLKYGGLINPFKLQKALAALGRDDDLTRLLTQVAESAAFVFSVEPCVEDPDFYDLTVRDHNNYLAGESGLVVIHNSGHNLSPLRSSKEPLSAGGRSSGPIAFMKGLDASAGSIKSGGSTRRAAKMVILNADHPDIQEFIDCKKDAELKAHALIDAGYSGAFNVSGGAYDTVPFQNANHSVRVTDEFMQAVEADGPWETKFRTDGKTAETLRAKDLLHSIAEGTWVCGDPGMQYDTTANDWHTCANTDRIHASNPCVTGDTLVATSEGWQRIDALVGQSARVIGADGLPHFVDKIFPTGHKPVFNLRTRAGFEVTITGNHQVLTTERGDVAVEDLHLGEHLHLEGAGFGRHALNETLALAIGVAVGDGCLSRQVLPHREQEYVILTMAAAEAPILDKIAVELNRQKTILRAAGLAGHPGAAAVVPQSASGTSRLSVGSACVVDLFKEFAVLGEGSSRKRFTPNVFDLDKLTMASVLRGLFTADGTVANYGDKSQYVALDSTSQELLQQVQMLLLSFGIKAKIYTERRGVTEAMLPDANREMKSYAVQETHSLRISKASRVIFEREIGFDPASAKAARLHDMNLAFTTYKDELTDEVVSITEAGTADVYDLTEAVTSHFVANGLVVHNCSEFFFLNSTACNLSSLNLMKFRDAGSGAFDTDSFEHAVKVMITAQEIVVGFAHYPTEKIEERSHRFRPLGLGYANLGALLMADGLPYDSDAGRAYAGAVTALMTGRAYHQSAQIARDCGGPFAGFAENRAPMLRVMGKHRAAVDDINGALIPVTLLDAARTAWDDALEEGQASGYRNAQATVLAPTGCLVAGSLVITDKGVVRLSRLGDVNGAQWQDVRFDVLTDTGSQKATKFYVNGLDRTRRIETHCGYAIQGTPKHRIKVVNAQTGQWDWKRFGDIAKGDVVALSLGQMLGDPQTVTLPPLGEEYWTGDDTTRVPSVMTPELAEIVGYFMGDGSMHSKGPRFCVANTDLDVAERVQQLAKSLFNLDAHLTAQQGYCEVALHSVPLALWWDACGFSKLSPGAGHSGKGYLPRIPDAVLATNDPSVYGAFLRGLYEADGTVTGGIPCWSTVHRPFSEEVKTLLLALGIPTSTKQDTTGWSQAPLWVLRLRNTSYASKFTQAVGFMSARKAALVSQSDGVQTARHDYVYLAPEVIAALMPINSALYNAVTLSQKRHNGAITRRAAESLYAATRDERVAHALRFFYDVVTANEDGGEQLTYDLSVPANVTYIAQGFVSHNTIGFLMDCDTTGIEPDIAIVKYKSLVGGGMMKIVNQTVPEALERLGYDEAAATGIIKFIDEHDTIEGAPGLKPEHLAIFDCAFRPMNGTRSIHYRGHLKMMAAAQPFISGAISKTVNVPNDASPEDIASTYLEAWKLGIKAVAIYRDGSKRTQPLNTASEKSLEAKAAAAEAVAPEAAPTQTLTVPKAVRRRLPDERDGVTHKFSIGGHEGYLTVGLYPDTRQPGEIFIRMSKEGSSISGLMDSFATAISLALQYGVPLSTLVDKFIHSRFEPSGFTGNKEIPMAKSVMDYIFRYLALRFLQKEDRHNVGLLADQPADGDAYAAPPKPSAPAHDSKSGTLSNKNGNGSGSGHHPANAHLAETSTASVSDHEREIYRAQSDAPPCPECGAITIRNGACYRCISCGTSLGCS